MESSPEPTRNTVWISPRSARALLGDVLRTSLQCQEAILERLAGGLVASKCIRCIYQVSSGHDSEIEDDIVIKQRFWISFIQSDRRISENWEIGDFQVAIPIDGRRADYDVIKLYGVQFNCLDLQNMVGPDTMDAGAEVGPPEALQTPSQDLATPLLTTAPKAGSAVEKDIKRIANAYLCAAGPEETGEEAFRFVQAFLSPRHVARDRFRAIYRDLRGSKKPGPSKGYTRSGG